jgi:hypothetical protein
MDGFSPIICLKCGSYIVWSTQPHLVYRTPTCVCHTEEQCVCHTEEQLVSPVTSPLLGKRCWPAWPHYNEDHGHGCGYEDESSLAHRGVHPHEPLQLPRRCELCRIARSSDVHPRSAATDPVGAPTPPVTASDDPRRTLSNPQQGARITDATQLADARPKIPNDMRPLRSLTVFEPRCEGQAFTSRGVPASDEGAPRPLQSIVRVGEVRPLAPDIAVSREVFLHDVGVLRFFGAVEAEQLPRLEVTLHHVIRGRPGGCGTGLACRQHRGLQNEHTAPSPRAPVVQAAASITLSLCNSTHVGYECNFEGGDVTGWLRLHK